MTEAYDPRCDDEQLTADDVAELEQVSDDQADSGAATPAWGDSDPGPFDDAEPAAAPDEPAQDAVPAAPEGSCAVRGCGRTAVQRGLCPAHWDNLRGFHG